MVWWLGLRRKFVVFGRLLGFCGVVFKCMGGGLFRYKGRNVVDLNSLYKSRVLGQFEPLVHKSLARLFISPRHVSYEDYAQELRVKLLEIEASFDGEALGVDRIRFVAFAGRGLYWFLVSLLRKERQVDLVAFDDVESALEGVPFESSRVELVFFLEEVRRRLSADELELFNLLADGSWSVTEIARFYGMQRKAIYRRKQRIVEKMSDLKELLF